MKRILLAALLAVLSLNLGHAFCGFYVAKTDAKLFNKSSQIIFVRDGNRSVITMSNDYQGSAKDFAMVIPVPVVLQRNDIRVARKELFSTLDGYSGPRLVEYYDNDPCPVPISYEYSMDEMSAIPRTRKYLAPAMAMTAVAGVEVLAEYTVEEYDIVILSAKESGGLKTWLNVNGYKIPGMANDVIDPYIKSGMNFFVVKVNMENHAGTGFEELRPLQIAFDNEKFMLPIRLGMANADGSQDMIVYALTKSGRVESTNYRTVKMPTANKVPVFVKDKFGPFYKDAFAQQYFREYGKAVFLEYAWNVTPTWGGMKCDPCVGPPPIYADLQAAGATWATGGNEQVFFTRLHVRYSRDRFPQDLQFQVTPNTEHYQARYVITHPANSTFDCEQAQPYLRDLVDRRKLELQELVALTGWGDYGHYEYVNQYAKMLQREDDKRNFFPFFGFRLPNPPSGGTMILALLGILLLVVVVLVRRKYILSLQRQLA